MRTKPAGSCLTLNRPGLIVLSRQPGPDQPHRRNVPGPHTCSRVQPATTAAAETAPPRTEAMTQTPTVAEEALANATNDASLARSIARSAEIEADIAVNPGRYRMFTGVRPTGNMHLGHYFGTMHSWKTIQDAGVETWILVADYQVITDRDGVGPIRERVLSLVTDALAVGVDPQRSTIFAPLGGPGPEPADAALPVPGDRVRAPPQSHGEVRAGGHRGRAMSGLLLTYPVHQATDILFCQANLVPVGKDQLPHLEQARLIAQRFDKRYGRAVKDHPVFRRPEALLSQAPMLLGLDGEKMSKSRRNTIELGMSADETAKRLCMEPCQRWKRIV